MIFADVVQRPCLELAAVLLMSVATKDPEHGCAMFGAPANLACAEKWAHSQICTPGDKQSFKSCWSYDVGSSTVLSTFLPLSTDSNSGRLPEAASCVCQRPLSTYMALGLPNFATRCVLMKTMHSAVLFLTSNDTLRPLDFRWNLGVRSATRCPAWILLGTDMGLLSQESKKLKTTRGLPQGAPDSPTLLIRHCVSSAGQECGEGKEFGFKLDEWYFPSVWHLRTTLWYWQHHKKLWSQ